MTVEAIRAVLMAAAKLRIPKRVPHESAGAFGDRLGDYLLLVAYSRADLEEARIHAYAALEVLEDRWEAIDGWETIAGTRNPTRDQKDEAKRALDTDGLWQGIKDARRLLARLTDQIKRLGGLSDDEVVSRAYTLFSGA